MISNTNLYIVISLLFFTNLIFGQVIVTPKISATHNHYYWNNESLTAIEHPQEWTWGIGAVARIPLSKKLYGQLAITTYPLGLKYEDERFEFDLADFVSTTSTDIFDIKLGLDYKLYPNTLLGVGIEMEQYFNSKTTFTLNNIDELNYLNRKFFGFEVSLTQWIGKVELSADVFIGLHEGGLGSSLVSGNLFFISHKKLQLGMGIPIGGRK